MGYTTEYSLQCKPEILKDFRLSCPMAEYSINENGDPIDAVKWYTAQKDLINFSRKYPTELFTLIGRGEDRQDIWKLYVINGKSQLTKAKISFEKFDERKLK